VGGSIHWGAAILFWFQCYNHYSLLLGFCSTPLSWSHANQVST
jgi:hypothetical protein